MARPNSYRASLLPLSLAAALLAGGTSLAFAQSTSTAALTPSAKLDGSLKQSHDAWRASMLDGATVYNSEGNDIDTVNDMLLDSTGKVSNVVLSVGGYLGIDSKYVEVPFTGLKFEPSKGNDVASTNADNHDYSVVLPNATKNSLKSMTGFTY